MIKIMVTLWLMMVCLTTNIYGLSYSPPTVPPLPPHCVYNGEMYPPGNFQPDPCTTCECGTEGEEAMCYMSGCHFDPAPPTVPATPACKYEGEYYLAGHFKPSPCKHCTCTDTGLVNCAIIDCEPPACQNPVQSKDKCCPTCPDGSN